MVNKYKALAMLIKLMVKNDPLYLPVLIFKSIMSALDSLVNIFVPMIFIRQITHPRPIGHFIKLVVGLTIIKFLIKTFERILNKKEFIRRQAINEYIKFEISKKAMDLSYENIESAKTLDLKERASFAISTGAIHSLLQCSKDIIQGVLTMTGTALVIINFSPILVGISLVISLAIILVNTIQASKGQKFDQGIVLVNRRFSYYFNLMGGEKFQKEIRVFDLGDLIKSKTKTYLTKMKGQFHKRFAFDANMDAIKIFLASIIRLISYTYVAARTLTDIYGPQISFAEFSAIVSANESFMNSFQTIFSEISSFNISLKNLEPLYEFMDLEEEINSIKNVADDFKSLEFKNVYFTYPGSDRLILEDVSFRINKGEKISIVGVNNAGKTTIVKLILGFFKVDQGEILYNGENIESFDKNSLYDKITGVLQDFSIMPFTIKKNIIAEKPYDKNLVENILDELDLKERIDSLDKGVDTYLNKEIYENATDLSLGQKQKLAIARALYQDANFLILDEPTASLDPLAESNVYDHFNHMTRGKTSIFISHRMSSSRFTDKVLLLDGGRVSAFDSHKNLMKYDNVYSKLYTAQAKYFN